MRVLLVLIALGAVAHAESDLSRARRHFETARALYRTQNFEEAMHEFALGYELAPKPEFLLNIGLCYRGMGKWEQARDNFQRFLRDAPADHPQRREVQVLLGEMEQRLQREPAPEPTTAAPTPTTAAPTTAAPTPSLETTRPTPSPTIAPPTTAVPDTTSTTASTHAHRSWWKRNWWVVPVVTIAAAGVAVGLGVGLSPKDPCLNAGACVPVTR